MIYVTNDKHVKGELELNGSRFFDYC